MHTNWPEGDDLAAASRRGDMIREMMRERGYPSVTAIIEDLLASVAVEEQKEQADHAWRSRGRPALTRLHTLSAREAATVAIEEVERMVNEAAE
jgi:hypothetical protein